jgi:hypothetical protein
MIASSWVFFSLVVGVLALPHEQLRTKVEAVKRVGRVHFPHLARQIVSNDGFDVLHREYRMPMA